MNTVAENNAKKIRTVGVQKTNVSYNCRVFWVESGTVAYAEGEDIEMQLEVAYAEADQTAEITLTCTGTEYDPFAQEDAGLGVTILKKMASYLDYTRKEDRNYITVNL